MISTWKSLRTTLLHIAAGFGSEMCVKYLLEKGANVNFKDADGVNFFFLFNRLPIHDSAHNGTLSVFKLLINSGSNPSALDDYNVLKIFFFLIEYATSFCIFFR